MDDDDFDRWATRHRGILVRIARAFATAGDTDDLLQEMLLALWHARPGFAGRAAESTFVYRIALNTALAWQRRHARHRHLPLDDVPEPPDDGDPAVALDALQRSAAFDAALARLPAIDRALLLMQLDDASYRVMADVTGLTETNVGARLTRARRRLATFVQEHAS